MKLLICIVILNLVVQDVHLAKSSKPAMSNITVALQKFTAHLVYRSKLLNGQRMENILFSPISIAETLGMVMTGARGTTYEKIRKQLVPELLTQYGQKNIDNLFRKIRNKTFGKAAQPDRKDNAIVTTANKAYIQDSLEILPQYEATLRDSYAAEAELMDFSDTGYAADRINSWINNKTEGMIPQLIESSDLSALTRLVLVNALYFEAQWKRPMQHEGKRIFYDHSRQGREINFIGEKMNAGVTRNRHFTTVYLRYNSSVDTYMVIHKLPTQEMWDRFFQYNGLRTYFTETIVKPRRRQKVHISMPQFDLDVSTDLTEILKNMELQEMFDPTANFSGIATSEQLYLSKMKHKAKISVSKAGTKGAAASAGIFLARSVAKTRRVVIDTPFVFSIVRNNHVLFFGAVKNLS